MTDIYDILQEDAVSRSSRNVDLSPKAYAEKKQLEKEEVFQMIETAMGQMAEDPAYFKQYLDTQARLDRYSVANAVLIMEQKPDAVKLKSFADWKEEGVFIKKRERGIQILEPHEYVKKDGTTGIGYNVKKVFDISQTTAKHEPVRPMEQNTRIILKALIEKSPVTVKAVDFLQNENSKAYYDYEGGAILVKRGLDADAFFRSVAHEVAHAETAAGKGQYVREDCGFQADSITYMLCQRYGFDKSGLKTAIPDQYQGVKPMELREKLSECRNIFCSIAGKIDYAIDKDRARMSRNQDIER